MSLLTPLGHYLSRKRHARGFGIHSPFAFAFVCKVLGEKAGYYAYDVIEQKATGRKHRREVDALPVKTLKMLFRTVNYFRPTTIIAAGSLGEEVLPALLEPDSRTTVVRLGSGLPTPAEYKDRITDGRSFQLWSEKNLTVVGTVDEHTAAQTIEAVISSISTQSPVIMLDANHKAGHEVLKACNDAMNRGMIFHNDGPTAIIVPYARLPRQDFRISF